MKIFLLLLLISFDCFAVDIAFIEMRSANGKLIQLEKNGRFAHIAISYKGNWLHSHPYRGVEIITNQNLQKMGSMTIIHLSNRNELTDREVKFVLNKPYDNNFSWDDEKLYCSELIAKILGILPGPMRFQSSIWKGEGKRPVGELGISPDDIFRIISK